MEEISSAGDTTSLIPLPERVPVKFCVVSKTQYGDIHRSIAEEANKRLYKYSNYQFEPPALELQNADKGLVKKVYKDYQFDELNSLAFDGNQLRKLNATQLKRLRHTGKFGVPSRLFTGSEHVWRLSEIFQKGIENSTLTFYRWLAAAHWLVQI